MFPVNCVQYATGFEIRFLMFGGCVKNVSPISSNVLNFKFLIPSGIKETARMGPSEVIYKCVRCSSLYATIKNIRRHVCRKSFLVT